MIKAFPKIFHVGDKHIVDLFSDIVEITEKIDGCVWTENKILRSDLTYVRAGDIKVGDELVGFDETLNGSRFRKSIVTHAEIIQKECYDIIFEDGRQITASADHPWVEYALGKEVSGLSKRYKETQHLSVGDSLVDIGYWEHEKSYESGYIAGQYDGEGSLVGPTDTHKTRALSYYQKEGDGALLIKDILESRGFNVSYSAKQRKPEWKNIETLRILGGTKGILKFLGTFRPQRLLRDYWNKTIGDKPLNITTQTQIISIKYSGIHEVMGLSTSTKTYIVDGFLCHNSQFCWMATEDGLYMRSKGAMIYSKDHFTREMKENDLFFPATRYVLGLYERDELPIGWSFFGETLCKPRHSTLKYSNVPKNNIALFGCIMSDGTPINDYRTLKVVADNLEINTVPLIFQGNIIGGQLTENMINEFLDRESYLGGTKIEGFVAKKYIEHFVGGQLLPIMAGKYVSEQFKEVHKVNWVKQNTSAGKWNDYKECFRTEARWNKAVQYLREGGILTETPRDIGPIIQRVVEDIREEEKENIKEFLWREFGKDVLRTSTHGLPEWWKKQLVIGE